MNKRILDLLNELSGGAGPRADMPSLSPKEALILKLLTEHGETYGLGLVASSCVGTDAFPPLPAVGAVTTVAPLVRDEVDRSGVDPQA